MKKILSLALCLIMAFSLISVQAQTASSTTNFEIVKIPLPDSFEQRDSWRVKLRFKNGEPITLSEYYDGYVFGTIPKEYSGREVEAFIPQDIEFTDKDNSRFEFHTVERLSQTGVIKGNEKGEAKPFDNVTRAEAAAMIRRFLNLPLNEDIQNPFEDVNKEDWFYNEVSALFKTGIVKGDSETLFSPQRNVSREEITVMVVRALEYAGLNCAERTVFNAIDTADISDWAKTAYDKIGGNYISDYDDTDYENPVRVLNPKKDASRYDVAYILTNCANGCQLYPSNLAVEYGFDKAMPKIDGSTSTHPFTQAVYTKLFLNGPSHSMYPTKHSKSHASYQRLINGEVDMIFASVYPASDILDMAAQKGVELELIPIAYDAMIFFTNSQNSAEGLTKEQITDIYVNNKYSNWKDLGGEDSILYAYCRNNDSGSHAQMERHFLNGGQIHPEVQKETSMTMSNILTDVMAVENREPKGYGLGYSIYYYYHNMDLFYDTKSQLKLLAIDGVKPTDETIANGSYPLSNNSYIAIRKDSPAGSPERKMAEFMLSAAGQECVANAGYGRLSPQVSAD